MPHPLDQLTIEVPRDARHLLEWVVQNDPQFEGSFERAAVFFLSQGLQVAYQRSLQWATQPEALAVTVDEAGRMLGCSRSRVFTLIRQRQLKSSRLGRRTMVTMESIRALLAPVTARRVPEDPPARGQVKASFGSRKRALLAKVRSL